MYDQRLSAHRAMGTRERPRRDAKAAKPNTAGVENKTPDRRASFGTLKAWMGATHFLTKTMPRVSTEMSLHVLAYNLKRAMQILGIAPLMKAIST